MSTQVESFMQAVSARSPAESEFLQAVGEVVESVLPVLERRPEFRKARILERMIEPERTVTFRVTWVNDSGEVQINRGYRVQFNSAIGPYKGGLRFHSSVTLSVIKFLGFEQIFKNALTSLPLGGGKGGSDFDPHQKSDGEVMRFCQAFMSELYRHIGADTDVPAGDIGVGFREIGFMFGQYRKIMNRFDGTMTGKGINWGGSLIRPEATGYGCVYFTEEMLKTRGDSLHGKRVVVSGSGNVAQYAVEKLNQLGGKAIALSDSSGFIVDEDGIDTEKLDFVMELKNVRRGRISEYASKYSRAKYTPFKPNQPSNPMWAIPCQVALPCATQNELNDADASNLIKNGCLAVAEGANMPTTPAGAHVLIESRILFGPGKAANAGGVATSGLEMTQNSTRVAWPREQVDAKLREIMAHIHKTCCETAADYGMPGNYVAGANIAGFLKVGSAMLDQGIV